jgi:hypothetical protein
MPLGSDDAELADSSTPIATVVNEEGVRFALLQLTTGRCEVLASGEEIALVEIVEAPDDYDLEDGLLEFEGVAVQPNVLRLGSFGGTVVLFDSARQGDDLDGGPVEAAPDPIARAATDVVRVEVETGCWSVSLFEIEQAEVKLTGAWLQREEPAA